MRARGFDKDLSDEVYIRWLTHGLTQVGLVQGESPLQEPFAKHRVFIEIINQALHVRALGQIPIAWQLAVESEENTAIPRDMNIQEATDHVREKRRPGPGTAHDHQWSTAGRSLIGSLPIGDLWVVIHLF